VNSQVSGDRFNRGALMNVGFLEAKRTDIWDCFVFHDVDLLPKSQKTTYKCQTDPYHMASAIDKFNYKLPYADYSGGVLAMTREQYSKCNGHSNSYWGWGGEDDDMTSRIRKAGCNLFRLPSKISRYDMLQHDHVAAEEAKDR
jgi:predicted glycosyltransferase involved in capsule biosynthesis